MEHTTAPETIKRSVRALLTGAVDYAGLFPPSALSMPEAVINYATYRNSNYSWMLGRFVAPAARLEEFSTSARDFISRDVGSEWRVSAVSGPDLTETLALMNEFNGSNKNAAVCDTVEIKAASAEMIEQAASVLPTDVKAYFEIAPDDSLADMVATLALTGQRAKLRTGGVTADAFPSTTDIIKFVRTCLGANVPFKATAGLHHPVRCFKPLTYAADAPSGTMHGFLNVFLMCGFASQGFKKDRLEELMEEEFDEVFQFTDQEAIWRDEFRLNLWQIESLRSRGIQSFGSCSFDEPVTDLQQLGVL